MAKSSKPKKIAAKKISSKKAAAKKVASKKWSAPVTEHSDAMDLEKDVFKLKDPKKF